MDSHDDDFQLMIWNAHSVRPKRIEFFDYLLQNDISAAAICETYLREGDSLYHPHFRIYRLDRPSDSRGGGVAIVLRYNMVHELLPCP